MIVRREWEKNKNSFIKVYYTGYFLFGFLPLYISIKERVITGF